MEKISNVLDKKIKCFIWSLVASGIFMIFLAILIVWTDLILRLIIGLLALVVAYIFLFGAYKLWTIKKIIDKYIKF